MRNIVLFAGLAGLFMGWNAPNHYPPWTTFHLELFAALGLGLIGLAVFAWPPTTLEKVANASTMAATVRVALPTSARVWLFIAFLPVAQFATGALAFRGDALIGMLYGLGVAFGIYIGAIWAAQQGSEKVTRALCLTIVVGGLAAGGVALSQWLRLATPGWWAMELIDDRPFASFAQPNHFGLLMVMATVAITALFEMGAIQHRWVYGLAAAFFGFGAHISQSRSSAFALALIVVLWIGVRHRAPTRLRLADVLAAIVAWFVLGMVLNPVRELLFLTQTAAPSVAEVGPRLGIWLHFWAAIMERPLFGYGFNQGVLALADVADRVQPSRNVTFAHNVLLDLMTWFGIPAALAMTAGLALWLTGWLKKAPTPQLMLQRHCVLAIWLAFVVQSMLEFPYAHSYFLLPAALLAGAVTGVPPSAQTVHGSGAAIRASRWVMAMAAATGVLLFVLAWEYFQIEEDFRFNRFKRGNFSSLPSHETLQRPWILDQLGALNASADDYVVPDMPAQQLQRMHALARRFHMLSLRLDYAQALALNGRMADAQAEMRIIRSVTHPGEYRAIERRWQLWNEANADAIARSNRATK